MIFNLRFLKNDAYNGSIFIVHANKEHDTHARLLKHYKTLKKTFDDIFLPIYATDEYATVCLKFINKDLDRNSTYEVDFNIKKKTNANTQKTYINCYLNKLKLIEKSDVDFGEDIDLE